MDSLMFVHQDKTNTRVSFFDLQDDHWSLMTDMYMIIRHIHLEKSKRNFLLILPYKGSHILKNSIL